MPKQYCLLFWNLKENLTTIVISAWFVLLWVKRTTGALWKTALSLPVFAVAWTLGCFHSNIHCWWPASSPLVYVCAPQLSPLLHPSTFISPTATLGTCGTTQLEKVSKPGNLFKIFHNNNYGGGGEATPLFGMYSMSLPSPEEATHKCFLTLTNLLLFVAFVVKYVECSPWNLKMDHASYFSLAFTCQIIFFCCPHGG